MVGGGRRGQEVRQQEAVAVGVREPEDVGAAVGAPQPAQPSVPVAAAEQGARPSELEIRCPLGHGGILLKLLRTGAATIAEGNLIEVACRRCLQDVRQQGGRAMLVLHRFAMDGTWIETATV
jgi:hypothetical protein